MPRRDYNTKPPIPQVAREAFDELSHGRGCLGDVTGYPAYGYARVSTKQQAEDDADGLPRQIRSIHNTAQRHGLRISLDDLFVDDFTGFRLNRPAMDVLRRAYTSGRNGHRAVVTENEDRLGRKAWIVLMLREEIHETHGLDLLFADGEHSRLVTSVKGVVGEEGGRELVQRMLAGRRKTIEKGGVLAARSAYGYQRVGRGKDARYVIYEPEAAIVREIYHRYVFGEPSYSIAASLRERGVPCKRGGTWDGQRLLKMMANPVYKGVHIFGRQKNVLTQYTDEVGRWYEKITVVRNPAEHHLVNECPAVVSEDTWNAAQRMMTMNKKTAHRPARNPYLLTGLVRCDVCGRVIQGDSKRGGRDRYYRCPTRDDVCKRTIVARCEQLDDAIWAFVCQRVMDADAFDEAIDRYFSENGHADRLAQAESIERLIARLRADDEAVVRGYLDGVLDSKEAVTRRGEIKAQIARLEAEAAALRASARTPDQIAAEKRAYREIVVQFFATGGRDASFEEKQRIIKVLFDEIRVRREDDGSRITVSGTYAGLPFLFPISAYKIQIHTFQSSFSIDDVNGADLNIV